MFQEQVVQIPTNSTSVVGLTEYASFPQESNKPPFAISHPIQNAAPQISAPLLLERFATLFLSGNIGCIVPLE